MNEPWEDIVEREGRQLVSSNKAPFTLEDEASVWLVRRGAVDLFFVEAEDGRPTGMRQHLFRIEAGGALFGISAKESGFVFLAVGTPDTSLVCLPKAPFQSLAAGEHRDKVSHLIEDWVSKLSATLTRSVYPRPATDLMLQAGASSPGRNKTVSTQKDVVWLGPVPAGSLYIGLEFLPEGKALFPLTPDTWLQMGADGVVETCRTADGLERREFWDGLAVFHTLFLACHATNLNLERVDEYLKLKDTAAYRDKAMRQAVHSLAGMMEGAHKDAETAQELDPLVTACHAVAAASGVSFRPLPSFKSEKYRDPLRALLHASRIRAREVSLVGRWWRTDAGAMLAFSAKERRPLALLPASPGRYRLFDPKTGTTVPVTAEVASSLADKACAFYRTFPDRSVGFLELLKFGFAASRRDLLIIVLTGVAASLLGFLVPVFTGVIFDSVIPEGERVALFQLLGALVVSGVAIGVFQMARSISLLRIETRGDVGLQGALWDRLLKLPARFFRTYSAGELAARANGINTIRVIMSSAAITILLGGILSLFNLALLFYYSPSLARWVMLVLLVVVVLMLIYGRFALRAYREVQQTMQGLEGVVFQLLTGVAKLRSSGTEPSAFALWVNRFRAMRQAQFRFGKIQNAGVLFYTALPSLSLVLAYYQFSRGAEAAGLSTGAFLAFIAAFTTIIASAVSIVQLYPSLLQVVPIYENLRPILQAASEVDEQKTLCEELKGGIEINHVSFRYRSDAPLVLQDISIQIAPGEHVALVGPSGGGKSTVLRLLLGFEKPESGTIYYDGQDMSKLDVTSVRRQIGAVLQNSKLTTGTIYQNIVGSFAELTQRDAWEAARLVGLEDDIRQMPMGMYTVVSEGGGTFSGGQRQRLILARALVRKPRVVMMDEATSFLDNQTQEIVTRSLERMKITRVIVAHRLSTIMNADTIYLIKDGVIAEKGTYQELVARGGVFAELVQRQTL